MEEEKIVVSSEKKKGKFLKKFIIFIVIIGLIVLGLGIIFPGLLWTKDLGVSYTDKDYNSIMDKLNYVKDTIDSGTRDDYTYTYGSVKDINIELTSEEITAFINENRPDYYALKNVQVKINSNGTIEATGNVNVDYVLNEVLGGRYSKAQIQKEIPALGLLPTTVNLYLNFNGSVINNKSNINVNSASVQGITLPSNIVSSSEAINTVTEGIDNVISKYNTNSGSTFNNISVKDSKIQLIGKFPTSLERIKN